MADDIDLANALVDIEVSRALDKIRQNVTQNVNGAKFCIECDDEMPEPRRKLGFQLCVSCAGEKERRKSLFAG